MLPIALAIAASPFPVIPAILLLLTTRPRANGGSFLAGWVIGIAASTAVFVALASLIGPRGPSPAWTSWVRIALGLALLVLAARQWSRRRTNIETPAWLRAIDESTPRTALRLGVLLSAANPKILVLTAAAGLAIASADLSAARAVGTLVVFTVVAAVTVALPLLLYVTLGERMLNPLRAANTWLVSHNAAVMAVVIALIGAYLLVDGVAQL